MPHEFAKQIIEICPEACRMTDRKGVLPAHIACNCHGTLETLRALLSAYPKALFAKTSNGRTLLGLAKSSATDKSPNFALIQEIKRQMSLYSTAEEPTPQVHRS